MSDTETKTRNSLSPDTRVKMSLFKFMAVIVVVFGFAVANTATWINSQNTVNRKLDNLAEQNSSINARLDKIESVQVVLDSRLSTDEKQADHFSDWIKNRLNIKTDP